MQLLIKQKKILVEAYENGERDYSISSSTYRKLEKCKDTETLCTDAARFLRDYGNELKYGRKTPQELKDWVKLA